MAKYTYQYNPETLTFEKYKMPRATRIFRAVGFVSMALMFALVLAFLIFTIVPSPKEKELALENKQLRMNLDALQPRLQKLETVFAELSEKDRNLYRAIFDAEPVIVESALQGGIGGVDRYKYLENLPQGQLLKTLKQRMDNVHTKAVMLSRSYDDLAQLVTQKEELLAHMPAIQPINNEDLTYFSSGFGYRLHPILKIRRLHAGVDFTAPTGTDIYSTGDGVVETAKYVRGYGRHVVIDHGFGYKTLYGHMSELKVRRGQKIKRGELIGLVGSTGLSTGPHLHYEVIKNGKKVNPIHYFHNDLTPEEYEIILKLADQSNKSFD